MAQWLRVCTAPALNECFRTNSHFGQLKAICNSNPRDLTPSSICHKPLYTHTCEHDNSKMHTCTHN